MQMDYRQDITCEVRTPAFLATSSQWGLGPVPHAQSHRRLIIRMDLRVIVKSGVQQSESSGDLV
jgi:hypothetical protein